MGEDIFRDHGLVRGPSVPKAIQIVLEVLSTSQTAQWSSVGSMVQKLWSDAEQHSEFSRDLRGGVFEAVLGVAFIQSGLLPFYTQAQIQHVPNVIFDFVFWTVEGGPISISAKTSLRERYKQADLEAMALASVHRRAKSYLVTLDAGEAARVKAKIALGEVLGLEDVIVANTASFDDLIANVHGAGLIEAPVLPSIGRGKLIT